MQDMDNDMDNLSKPHESHVINGIDGRFYFDPQQFQNSGIEMTLMWCDDARLSKYWRTWLDT